MEGATKARGVQFTRKPKLTQHQQADGRRQLENGEFARSIVGTSIAIMPSLRGCARPKPVHSVDFDDRVPAHTRQAQPP
jgi:hypothetical protein